MDAAPSLGLDRAEAIVKDAVKAPGDIPHIDRETHRIKMKIAAALRGTMPAVAVADMAVGMVLAAATVILEEEEGEEEEIMIVMMRKSGGPSFCQDGIHTLMIIKKILNKFVLNNQERTQSSIEG